MKKSNNVGHSIKLSKETIDNLKIGIVVSRFNNDITEEMSSLCLDRLFEIGIKQTNIEITNVPGSFEIPYAVKSLIHSKKFDSIIALGALIKGETIHFETIANSVSISLINISTETLTPVIFGILTTENKKQAIERIKQAIEYAEIAVEMGSKKIN